MADAKTKPAIPAWQRARGPAEQEEQETQPKTTFGAGPGESEGEATPSTAAAETNTGDLSAETAADVPTSAQQLQKATTFLEDAAVKDAPREKKQAFLESKGISSGVIDQALAAASASFNARDFSGFQQTQPQTHSPVRSDRANEIAPPPIITYPEFLVEAHKPPPLLTAARVLNATYILGGVATLIYAASRHLVAPMSAELNDARHEFATHSHGKIEEMNERLSRLASKIPDTKRPAAAIVEADRTDGEDESVDGDPTELFHRDIGVQTSPPSSRHVSVGAGDSSSSDDGEAKADSTTHQSNTLSGLHAHLNAMLTDSEAVERANRERQEDATKLRQYLDRLTYAGPVAAAMWQQPDGDGRKAEDGVEALKREIRNVKGVLLSAKRFPAAGGRTGV